MTTIVNPKKEMWPLLTLRAEGNYSDIRLDVAEILDNVKTNGDKALYDLTLRLDGVSLESLYLSESYIDFCKESLNWELKIGIETAINNIESFHLEQISKDIEKETFKGVYCQLRYKPIKRVGIYIPGGTAPLLSTVMMLAIPAKIAGCEEIILFTPPSKNGLPHPAIVYVANRCGIKEIISVGGVQAIGAMAFGTESIKRVDKIFGPGNSYVTMAKSMVVSDVGIDMLAGPSELMVIADQSCIPEFVAWDLLSQAEHGVDSQVMLLTDNIQIATKVVKELNRIANGIPRAEIAIKSLANSRAIVFDSLERALEFSELYSPEHLILAVSEAEQLCEKVTTAGSVFLGHYTPESCGDYISGTNHTLPTGGWGRFSGGITVDCFRKSISIQRVTKEAMTALAPMIISMAEAEGLYAHGCAAAIRVTGNK